VSRLDGDVLPPNLQYLHQPVLDQLDGEERNSVYKMLRLEITPQEDGTLDVRGILSDRLEVLYENGKPAEDFVPAERHLSLSRTIGLSAKKAEG
jgi:hypothetical protein